ncbi:glycoside hydrolase domain-containing protein [Pantoea ananatis]|uniref:glycoside hydrolase domain-containing protein n=1 Tax=Pantoea ananas TaxID=553 RepID=UPI0039B913CA
MAQALAEQEQEPQQAQRYREEAEYFRARATDYVYLFDPATRFFRGRTPADQWSTPASTEATTRTTRPAWPGCWAARTPWRRGWTNSSPRRRPRTSVLPAATAASCVSQRHSAPPTTR